jgi:putative PIN family toxin of toxin-antitoxin system
VLVVIDTNVLLVSISERSKYYWLYCLIRDKKIQIAFTTDIISEYEEQIALHWHPDVANDVTRLLTELSTAFLTTVYYNLELIAADKEDNKFVDCAFAANANFIITNDNHFNILKTIDFPTIPILRLEEFKELLQSNKLL